MDTHLFGRAIRHLWWTAAWGKVSTDCLHAISPQVVYTSSMAGATCIIQPCADPKRTKLQIHCLCLPNMWWIKRMISNWFLAACTTIEIPIAVTCIHMPSLGDWTISVKESHQIPRRPLPLNQLKHALGTQGVSCTLVSVFLIHHSNSVCVEVIQLLPSFSSAKTAENRGMYGRHTLVNVGVVNLGHQMLVSTVAKVFLDSSDIPNVFDISVLCWVECHVLCTYSESFHVLLLICNVDHKWYYRRMFLH